MSLPENHPRLTKRPFSTEELLADGIVHALALLAGLIAFSALLYHVLARAEFGIFAAQQAGLVALVLVAQARAVDGDHAHAARLLGTAKQAVAALERSFGALAPRQPYAAPLASARVATLPSSTQPVVLNHRGDPTQAGAVISWPTGGGMAGIAESRQLEILSNLFQNRLLDAMREKLGEAYAPQVLNAWPQDLENGGSLTALAQLSPKAVPVFFATAEEIAANLVARPPSADELERVVEPLRQQISRASTSSAFFMYQLEGATSEPAKFAGLRTLLPDYTRTTPEQMQALARKYLQPGRSWRLQIMPQGAAVASGPAKALKPAAIAPAEGR